MLGVGVTLYKYSLFFFKPVTLVAKKKIVIIKLNSKRFLGVLRRDGMSPLSRSTPGTLCF